MKNLCVDFDGVLHSYTSPFTVPEEILDDPVKGAIDWLKSMVKDYEISIYSTRSASENGIFAMRTWLIIHGAGSIIDKLKFPTQKPIAYLTIDDRAICFKGVFPTKEEIDNFKSWNKK